MRSNVQSGDGGPSVISTGPHFSLTTSDVRVSPWSRYLQVNVPLEQKDVVANENVSVVASARHVPAESPRLLFHVNVPSAAKVIVTSPAWDGLVPTHVPTSTWPSTEPAPLELPALPELLAVGGPAEMLTLGGTLPVVGTLVAVDCVTVDV